MSERCDFDYKALIIDNLNDIGNNWLPSRTVMERKRPKRFVFAFIAGYFVSNVVSTVLDRFLPHPNPLHILSKDIDDKLNYLNKAQTEALHAQANAIQELYRDVNDIYSKLNWMISMWPDFGRTTAVIDRKMNKKSDSLRRLRRSILSRRLDMDAVNDLIEGDWLQDVDPNTVKLINVRAPEDSGILEIEFYSNKRAASTDIFRVDSLTSWSNLSSSPTIISYAGPQYVALNRTSNCMKSVHVIDHESVIVYCPWKDYIEKSMNNWRPVKTVSKLKEAQQMTSFTEDYPYIKVSCFPGNITISDVTHVCLPFVFKLSADIAWNTTDANHQAIPLTSFVSNVRFNPPEELTKHLTPAPAETNSDLLKRIQDLREQLDIAQNITDATLSIPLNFDSMEEMDVHYLIYSIIACLFIFFFCCCRGPRRHFQI